MCLQEILVGEWRTETGRGGRVYSQASYHYLQLKRRVGGSSPSSVAYQFGPLKNHITSLCITSHFQEM